MVRMSRFSRITCSVLAPVRMAISTIDFSQVIGTNHLVGEQELKHGIYRPQQAVAEIRFLPWLHRIDVGWPKDVKPRKPRCEERLLSLTLVTRKRYSTSSRRIGAASAQERERCIRAAAAKHSRELDRIVDGDRPHFGVCHRSGIRAQAKDRCVLTCQRLCECGAVAEILMQDLIELRVRYTSLPTADRCHAFHSGEAQCMAKSVAADHSRRAHDDEPHVTHRLNYLSQRTLLNPVNIEQALGKQPLTVRLHEGVFVAKVGHHETTLIIFHCEMVRYALSLPDGSIACEREDGALPNEVHRRIVFVQVREDGSELLARVQFLRGCRVLRIHIHHGMRIRRKECHLAFRITTVRTNVRTPPPIPG